MKLTKIQIEQLTALGFSAMIIDTLTTEQIDKALNTKVSVSSGRSSNLMQGIADWFLALTFVKGIVEVSVNDVADAIGIIQLYNYFDSFSLNDKVINPTSKIDVKFLCENGKVVLSEKLLNNKQLDGVKVGQEMIAFKIWSSRGRAVVNSHLLKDKDNSQFNKNKYGMTVIAKDKNTLTVTKTA